MITVKADTGSRAGGLIIRDGRVVQSHKGPHWLVIALVMAAYLIGVWAIVAAGCNAVPPTTPADVGETETGGTTGSGGSATGGTVDECRYLPSGRSIARQITSRVVGGTPASPGSAPWIGALMVGGHQFCAATVIDDEWALTAAHCQVETTEELLVGTQDLTDGGQRVGIVEVRNHWRWTSTTSGHDVAVLRLAEPAGVEPIELARVATDEGTATVLGWGRTTEGGSASSTLLQAELPLVKWIDCYSAYPGQLDETMLCAGGADLDACQGDSGGPLVRDGKQLGIVSWGQGCGRPGYPGVLTSVPAVLDWIVACTKD